MTIKNVFSGYGSIIIAFCACSFVGNEVYKFENNSKQEKVVMGAVKETYVSLINKNEQSGKETVEKYLKCMAGAGKKDEFSDKSDCLYFTESKEFIGSMIKNISSLDVDNKFKEEYIGGKNVVDQFLAVR